RRWAAGDDVSCARRSAPRGASVRCLPSSLRSSVQTAPRPALLCLSVRSAGRFGALPSLLATLVSPDSAAPRSTVPVGPLRGALRCAAFPPRYARQSRQRRAPLCSLRLGRRADLHLTADDVLLELIEFGLQVGRYLAGHLVEVGELHAIVLQRADRAATALQRTARRGEHRVAYRVGDVLHDRREEHRAVLRRAHAAVLVDPDHRVLAARLLRTRGGAETRTAGHRHDDVGVLPGELV